MNEIILISALRHIFEKMGYNFFDEGGYNINLIFIRSKERTANKFDDFAICCFKDLQGKWCILAGPCTTDPGNYWLKNPMVGDGCAIQAPGQVRGAYKLGMHMGKFPALVQAAAIPYYRDNNRDTVLNLVNLVAEENAKIVGLNCHCVHSTEPQFVENISAGCIDFQQPWLFTAILAACRRQEEIRGWKKFTRTILDEVDCD